MDDEPVLEEAVDVDDEKATDGLLGSLPQEPYRWYWRYASLLEAVALTLSV